MALQAVGDRTGFGPPFNGWREGPICIAPCKQHLLLVGDEALKYHHYSASA